MQGNVPWEFHNEKRDTYLTPELKTLTRSLRASFEENIAGNVKHKPKLF